LAPLYWFALIGSIVPLLYAWRRTGDPSGVPSGVDVVLNVLLVFGFVAPTRSIVVGGWSIGNEVTYYVTLPVVLLAERRSRWWYALVLALTAVPAAYITFVQLDETRALEPQWAVYVNPLNHLVLFVAGVGIAGWIGRRRLAPASSVAAATLLAAAFFLLPTGPDRITIVTGWLCVAYNLIVVALCTVCALGTCRVPRAPALFLGWLGMASYSIYLLHPIAYQLAVTIGRRVPIVENYRAVVAAAFTAILAAVAYRVIESPMIRRGRIVATRAQTRLLKRFPPALRAPAA
jgi:peptidoglycan/LPS O-acetylase OafA/YrhL